MYYGRYHCEIHEWGHYLSTSQHNINQPQHIVRLEPDPVYFQPFDSLGGWLTSAPTPQPYQWRVRKGLGVTNTADAVVPALDFKENKHGTFAYASARYGECRLISPPFDIREMQNPTLQFRRWYLADNYLKYADAGDLLQVFIRKGQYSILIDEFSNVQDEGWRHMQYRLLDFVSPLDSQLTISFRLVEGDHFNRRDTARRQPVYAAIDQFIVADAGYVVDDGDAPDPQIIQAGASLFNVMPNPVASEFIILPLTELDSYSARLRISNILGQKFIDRRVLFSETQPLAQSVNKLTHGVYFVTLELADGRTQTVQIQVRD